MAKALSDKEREVTDDDVLNIIQGIIDDREGGYGDHEYAMPMHEDQRSQFIIYSPTQSTRKDKNK